MMAKDKKLGNEVGEHKRRMSSLEDRAKQLVQMSNGYLAMRRWFVNLYKRDAKKEVKSSKEIHDGNLVARGGDAIGDAVLFNRDQRTEIKIYRELCGPSCDQVLDLRMYTGSLFNCYVKNWLYIDAANIDGGIFVVLNAHATTLAKDIPQSEEFKKAFDCFLRGIEKRRLQPPDGNPNSPFGRAYDTVWRQKEVADIGSRAIWAWHIKQLRCLRFAPTDLSIVILTEKGTIAAAVVCSHNMKPVVDGSYFNWYMLGSDTPYNMPFQDAIDD